VALGVVPVAVVGHSSGEIAAAYASGYLSMQEAIIIAYYRGHVTKESLGGGMAAVGLGADDLSEFLVEGVVLACENSPNSSTISGDSSKVKEVADAIKKKLPDVLVRVLKVEMAYHSSESLKPLPCSSYELTVRNRPHDSSRPRVQEVA
jgi:acyl transferase domain-containing protein